MLTEQEKLHLSKLILKLIDNSLCKEELAALEQQLRQSPDTLAFYREFMRDYVSLKSRIHTYLAKDSPAPGEKLLDGDVWKALSENERTAAQMVIEKPQKEKEKILIEKVRHEKLQRHINKFSLTIAFLSAAALFAMILYVQYNPRRPVSQEVATLTDLLNPRWEALTEPFKDGDRLRTNIGPIQLNGGFAEITYDSGAKVVLEGPASFEMVSPLEMTLHYGRLYAKVSKTAKGFTVATRNSRVIDLGTEFGVHASFNGETELHVFDGKTTLVSGTPKDEKQVVDVVAGQAKRVRYVDSAVSDIELKKEYFVEKIDSISGQLLRRDGQPENQRQFEGIKLAAMVAGQDNFKQNKFESGIDPNSGNINPEAEQNWERTGHHGYAAVKDRSFIDGVFVPDGSIGLNKVSSAGHTFDGFPKTSNLYWMDITANPYIIEIQGREKNASLKKVPVTKIIPVFDDSEKTNQSCLLIHPNAAITFDLEKIRQANPFFELSSFTAVCRLPQAMYDRTINKSEFWVLLDGKCVFHYKLEDQFTKQVDIPITSQQRFLTLATTDGGDDISYDWCVFEQPEIKLNLKD